MSFGFLFVLDCAIFFDSRDVALGASYFYNTTTIGSVGGGPLEMGAQVILTKGTAVLSVEVADTSRIDILNIGGVPICL